MTQNQRDNPYVAIDFTAPSKVQKVQMRTKWADIGRHLIDDSSDEVPVLEDNNQIQRPQPILDDQIDAVLDLSQVKPILEEEDKEMEEELLETVPEQAPGKNQLDLEFDD